MRKVRAGCTCVIGRTADVTKRNAIWRRFSALCSLIGLALGSADNVMSDESLDAADQGIFMANIYDAATEEPLSDVVVEIGGDTFQTDKDGETGEISLAPGDYTITATLAPYEVYTKAFTIRSGTRRISAIGLKRPRFGSVRSRVVDAESGEPIAGALVEIRRAQAESDVAGRAFFNEVRSGRVSVWASHVDYADGNAAAELVGGGSLEISIELNPRQENSAALKAAFENDGGVYLYGIQFSPSGNLLVDASAETLRAVREVMAEMPETRFLVLAHTGAAGSEPDDQERSARRAQVLIDWLVAAGIAADRLEGSGRGGSEPVAPSDSPNGRALNRRIEIIIAE